MKLQAGKEEIKLQAGREKGYQGKNEFAGRQDERQKAGKLKGQENLRGLDSSSGRDRDQMKRKMRVGKKERAQKI